MDNEAPNPKETKQVIPTNTLALEPKAPEDNTHASPNSKPASERDMELFSKSMSANVFLGSAGLEKTDTSMETLEKDYEVASARIRAMAPRDPLEEFLVSSMLSLNDHAGRLWIQARANGRPDCIQALANAASKAQTRSLEAAKLLLESRRKPLPSLQVGNISVEGGSQAIIAGETSVQKKVEGTPHA